MARAGIAGCLVMALLAAGCASARGPWPSLVTPEEQARAAASQPGGPAPGGAPVVAAAPPAAAPAVASAGVAALASRLAEERRAYGFALARWQQERDAAEAALAAVRGAPGVSNPTWAAAQTAVSRVRQAAVGLGDARQAVERLTAGLALEAAAGADVSAILVGSGRLLREIDAARADADRQADGFAARLAR